MRAAREVFSEYGYEAATFQAIAIRADLTRPAINHYFSSKRVLYRKVLAETNDHLVTSGIERAQRETTLSGRLSALITAVLEADSENWSAGAFLITSVLESQRHPEWNRVDNDLLRTIRTFLTGAIDDAIEHGELTADTDVAALCETLLAVLCGVGFYVTFVGGQRNMEAIAERFRLLLATALAGVRD